MRAGVFAVLWLLIFPGSGFATGGEAGRADRHADESLSEAPDDAALAAAVVGAWVSLPSDWMPVVPGAVTEFFADQRVRYTQYQTHQCRKRWFTVEGHWWVADGRLWLQVDESGFEGLFPVGKRMSDEILVLNKKFMRVRDDKGRVVRRQRGDDCAALPFRAPVPPQARRRVDAV